MAKRISALTAITVLAGILASMITGCGGSAPDSAFDLSGNVQNLAPARTAGDVQYAPVMDYQVYAVNPATMEKVSIETRTDFRGDFRIRELPAHGDLLIVAERDSATLRAFITEQERTASLHCGVTPDTTVATSVAQQLRQMAIPGDQILEMYNYCLQYQASNRFRYGHLNGAICDLTSATDVNVSARELLRASTNEVVRLALQPEDRDPAQCKQMVTAGMCDAQLSNACVWKLTEEQRTKLALRTAQGDLWTPAEAAALISSAGIAPTVGPTVQTNDITGARERLITKIPAIGEGSRPKICAAELVMLSCQVSDPGVTFRVHTQKQLDDLIEVITHEEA